MPSKDSNDTTSGPLVSILIPTFNQSAEHLKACLDSAVAQDHPNIEVVVSDNHSVNPAREVLLEYRHSRVRVIKPPTFVTMTENFAFCARGSRGEYISFLSSDDLLAPTAISSLLEVLTAHPDVVFACGNIIRSQQLPPAEQLNACLIRSAGQSGRTYGPQEAKAFFFPWTMASTWMAGDLIRRVAYEQTGGFEKCDLGVIADIWLTRNLLDQGGFAYVSKPLAFYRARPTDHVDVDPARRLLEFSDRVLLRSTEDAARLGRARHWLRHIWLVECFPPPAASTARSCEQASLTLRLAGRHDLARAIQFYRRHPMVLQLLARIVRPPLSLKIWWDARRSIASR